MYIKNIIIHNLSVALKPVQIKTFQGNVCTVQQGFDLIWIIWPTLLVNKFGISNIQVSKFKNLRKRPQLRFCLKVTIFMKDSKFQPLKQLCLVIVNKKYKKGNFESFSPPFRLKPKKSEVFSQNYRDSNDLKNDVSHDSPSLFIVTKRLHLPLKTPLWCILRV